LTRPAALAGAPAPAPAPVPAPAPSEPTPPQADAQIDFSAARALPAGSAWTWRGTLSAPATGDYDLKVQTDGGRATLTVNDTVRLGGGPFGGGSLIPTS